MKVIFEFVVKRLLKQRMELTLMIAFPLLILIVPQIDAVNTPVIGYGLFAFMLLFSAFLLSKQMMEDRQYKTIVRIAASSISHKEYLIGHLTAYMTVTLIQIVVFSFFGYFVYQSPLYFTLLGFFHLITFGLMAICLSLFWQVFFKRYATSLAVYSIVVNLIALLGGLTFPFMYLPNTVKQFSVVLPTYWYSYGIDLLTNKEYVMSFVSLLIVLGFAIIFLTIGSKRRFE